MATIAWLLLALALIAPVVSRGHEAIQVASFLAELLSSGQWRPLSLITAAPSVRPLQLPGAPAEADLYWVPGLARAPGLVLVHGLSNTGKNDRRLRFAAGLLARAGWAVAVPTVPGLTALRLRPEDARPVEAAVAALDREGYRPVAILAVSLGASPAILAATGRDGPPPPISAVLLLGGYASTRDVLRYTLTGQMQVGSRVLTRDIPAEDIARFARANADLLGDAGAGAAASRDPARVDAFLAHLPPATQALLEELSPQVHVSRLRAPLFLIHGYEDPVVPFTESVALEGAARAAGVPVRLTLVGAVHHVEGGRPGGLRGVADAWRLWASFLSFHEATR